MRIIFAVNHFEARQNLLLWKKNYFASPTKKPQKPLFIESHSYFLCSQQQIPKIEIVWNVSSPLFLLSISTHVLSVSFSPVSSNTYKESTWWSPKSLLFEKLISPLSLCLFLLFLSYSFAPLFYIFLSCLYLYIFSFSLSLFSLFSDTQRTLHEVQIHSHLPN